MILYVSLAMLSHVRLFVTPWLQPIRILCPWDFPGKNTWVGCHSLLQGIFPTQGLNPISCVSCIGRQIPYHWATWEEKFITFFFFGHTMWHVRSMTIDWTWFPCSGSRVLILGPPRNSFLDFLKLGSWFFFYCFNNLYVRYKTFIGYMSWKIPSAIEQIAFHSLNYVYRWQFYEVNLFLF